MNQYDDHEQLKHLLTIEKLKPKTLLDLLDLAQQQLDTPITPLSSKQAPQTLANLFFEPSTRTRSAFECAATQLGWHTLNFPVDTAATQKGESLEDTLLTLGQMPIQAMAIRHTSNHVPAYAAKLIGNEVAIINAGDGTNEHPTQSLINMLAIKLANLDFSKLSIAIVGDIKHSRVAHSDLHSLHHLNVPDIRLIGPPSLMPECLPKSNSVKLYSNLNKGLKDVDVILMLRMQQERIDKTLKASLKGHRELYTLTEESLAHSKPHAIILHPGPVNRNIEICDSIVYCPQSRILHQVRYGIAVRMAVLMHLSKAKNH